MAEVISEEALLQRLKGQPPGRHIVAVAGAPASGKSTLAKSLVDSINRKQAGRAAVLPMDGFHYDDVVLDARGHRPRKGAPHTFDVSGLRHMLLRLAARDEPDVCIPVFDRDIEIARAGAFLLPRSVEIIVVEGNYLLLDQAPWDALREFFQWTVYLHVPEEVLRQRLQQRWVKYNLTQDQIMAKLEENDLPNGRLVAQQGANAELVITAT